MIMLSQAYRIASAKRTFVTRRVPLELMQSLVGGNGVSKPKSGDLVLAKIVQVGHHKFGERTDGRRAALFEGDEIILAYGHRYAPDQFEAVVPGSLEECHIVAAGGIAAQAISWHSKTKSPTVIQPVGLIADYSGKIINVSDFAVDESNLVDLVPSVAVVGTSMNAGKTTSAAHIIRGLNKAGYRVGAMKVTGTGAGGDLWLMKDSGAYIALDFTDAGHATTFKVNSFDLMNIVDRLSQELIRFGCNAIVVEIADGIFQKETRELLENREFRARFPNVVFAARESLGATAGVQWLSNQGYSVSAVSGIVCASPLSTREITQQIDTPVYGLDLLIEPSISKSLLHFPSMTPELELA